MHTHKPTHLKEGVGVPFPFFPFLLNPSSMHQHVKFGEIPIDGPPHLKVLSFLLNVSPLTAIYMMKSDFFIFNRKIRLCKKSTYQ